MSAELQVLFVQSGDSVKLFRDFGEDRLRKRNGSAFSPFAVMHHNHAAVDGTMAAGEVVSPGTVSRSGRPDTA